MTVQDCQVFLILHNTSLKLYPNIISYLIYSGKLI